MPTATAEPEHRPACQRDERLEIVARNFHEEDFVMAYQVMVDDNFHYMNPQERRPGGTFSSADEAITECRRIVDACLAALLNADKNLTFTPQELWDSYTKFGDDPFVVAADGEEPVTFSAWDYAREQCDRLCGGHSEATETE